MNISSVIVKVRQGDYERAMEVLKQSGLCDVHFGDKDKGVIIVTLEGKTTEEEVAKLLNLQDLPYILDAQMHMSYCEDELEEMMKYMNFDRTVNELNKKKDATQTRTTWDFYKK